MKDDSVSRPVWIDVRVEQYMGSKLCPQSHKLFKWHDHDLRLGIEASIEIGMN